MKDDPLRHELLAELRRIRTTTGGLRLESVATMVALIDTVGEGSVDRAYTTLLDVVVRHGDDREGDIRAYFETCGVDTNGDTLEARLHHYANRHHVAERTGLRRSDRGAERLSYILRDIVKYERPWATIIVVERGGEFQASVSVEIPSHAQWRRPLVYINRQLQEGRRFELHDSTTHERLVSGREMFPDLTMEYDAETEETVLRVATYWSMPVWPLWQAGAHLEDPSLHVRLTNDRTLSAEVIVTREPPFDGMSRP